MAREKKVVDASIIVKWFVSESDSEQALQLRAEHIEGTILLVVPELAFTEVLNALRYKGGTAKSLGEALQALFSMQFHVERTNRFLLEKACNLALQYDLTLYDAVYVAVSQIHGCALVTADEKMIKVPNVIPLVKKK